MDGRYHHFMTPLSDKGGPDRIVCVDCVGVVEASKTKVDRITERLDCWHTRCLRRKDQTLGTVWEASGGSAQLFWDALTYELRHPGQVWVLSWQAVRAWALLGLWDFLERGQVRISGGDYRAVYDPVTYGPKSKPGLLVTEDPPNLATLRVGAHPGQVLWVDCRNWGLDLPAETQRGPDAVGALASLVVRMDELASPCVGASLAPTAAGHAWRGWRNTPGAIGVHCHTNQDALEMERRAHVGARCEAFRLGVIPFKVHHLDFRSHYASIMRDEVMPVRLARHELLPDENYAESMADDCKVCADVTISTDHPCYPLKYGAEIIYPIGKFRTTLCGPELRDAVEHCCVAEWHGICVYEMADALSGWAETVYQMRVGADEEGEALISQWAKQLLNSVPGKLGYRRKCWETDHNALAPEMWLEWHSPDDDGNLVRWRSLAGVCQRETIGGYGPDAVPAMAAWICSYGRYRLLRAIRCAGWDNVVYCDTDSLFVNDQGYQNLIDHGRVADGVCGKLERRGECGTLQVLGVKYYVEDGKVTCSGAPRGVFVESADGQGRWYTTLLGTDNKANGQLGAVQEFRQWPKPQHYRHGFVKSDGQVVPWRMVDGKAV